MLVYCIKNRSCQPQSALAAVSILRTISTKEIYKNIPAVMEKIQGLAARSEEMGTPMKKPTKAVREEKRLAIRAFLKVRPSLINIAKSPLKETFIDYEIYFFLLNLCVYFLYW